MPSANLRTPTQHTSSSNNLQTLPKMQIAAGSGHQIVKLKRPGSNNPTRPMSGTQPVGQIPYVPPTER